ncbi:hypothetical protein WN48_09989 [Eufriesea mexicana]|uniref:Uncharacterized protein n=1 Tax=Eufriesea mexicana TaxID=516756 RepID=A0A310S6R6_9HYME|nr:hypothetical protein WN48_09989 [Eufriesea mexicana]
MLKHIFIVTAIIIICLSESEAQYDDKRCKCICPSLPSVINTTQSSSERKTYIINVPPSECKCENVVLSKVGDQLKASTNIGYHEHNNEEDDSSTAPGTFHAMGERGNVLNRVGHQQDKWKRQVREQRRNIYDRHTMLN